MTTHKHDPALVETVARAAYEEDSRIWHEARTSTRSRYAPRLPPWEKLAPAVQDAKIRSAQAALDAARPAIRREALEEAEKELEGWGDIYGHAAAAALKALMEKE